MQEEKATWDSAEEWGDRDRNILNASVKSILNLNQKVQISKKIRFGDFNTLLRVHILGNPALQVHIECSGKKPRIRNRLKPNLHIPNSSALFFSENSRT